MIICISGYARSGKDTISDKLAHRLGLPRVKYTFKDMAKDKGISLMEFQRIASNDNGKIDKEFDKHVIEEAYRLNKEKGGCIVSTWISPWMIKDADFRIFLGVSDEIAARRVMKLEGKTYEDALISIKKRFENNRERYLKYYDIDITDLSIFDLILDNNDNTPDETVDIIYNELKKRSLLKKLQRDKRVKS